MGKKLDEYKREQVSAKIEISGELVQIGIEALKIESALNRLIKRLQAVSELNLSDIREGGELCSSSD